MVDQIENLSRANNDLEIQLKVQVSDFAKANEDLQKQLLEQAQKIEDAELIYQ